jgi:hypothetical protein
MNVQINNANLFKVLVLEDANNAYTHNKLVKPAKKYYIFNIILYYLIVVLMLRNIIRF